MFFKRILFSATSIDAEGNLILKALFFIFYRYCISISVNNLNLRFIYNYPNKIIVNPKLICRCRILFKPLPIELSAFVDMMFVFKGARLMITLEEDFLLVLIMMLSTTPGEFFMWFDKSMT